MKTPPGISPAIFAKALQEFARIVGDQWVFTSDEDLDLYRDAYSPLRDTPEERVASAAVAPSSTEEVQAVVKVANRYSIPLYAISTGKNLGYGGSAPAYSGSVVVDLKRMNRIIEVDDRNHFALVEPGVSYFDLYDYIQKNKLKVWIDCPDPGWGSVIGNALDHGAGYTGSQFRAHINASCGTEVVLANGELMRTGMGAMPKANTWQQYKNGFGPVINEIFSQSNFGIVTKMGFWLMPQPETVLQGSVLVERYDDLHELVELLNYIDNSGLAAGLPELASPLLGLGSVKEIVDIFYVGPSKMSDRQKELIGKTELGYSAELQGFAIENGIPYWGLNLTFYGPAKVVGAQWEAVQDLATRRFKKVKFKSGNVMPVPLSAQDLATLHTQHVGVPNLEVFGIGVRTSPNVEPARGHMWFSPVIPRTGEGIIKANAVFTEAAKSVEELKSLVVGVKPFILPGMFFQRTALFLIGFRPTDDQAQNLRQVRAFRELIRIGAENGWGEYRTPVIFQDQVMGTYDFNDHALLRFLENIKDSVDPNGILSPGRYGIWPKHLRGQSHA